MATNFIQPGDTLTLVAPAGGVQSNSAYLIGSLFVVALKTAAAGELFTAGTTGVWELDKAAGACVAGAPAYFDGTVITATAEDNDLVGVFTADAAAPAPTANVLIGAHVVA